MRKTQPLRQQPPSLPAKMPCTPQPEPEPQAQTAETKIPEIREQHIAGSPHNKYVARVSPHGEGRGDDAPRREMAQPQIAEVSLPPTSLHGCLLTLCLSKCALLCGAGVAGVAGAGRAVGDAA